MSDIPPEEYGGVDYQAQSRIAGPAIGLIITAVLGMLMQLLGLLGNLLGIGMGASQGGDQAAMNMMSGGIGIAMNFLGMILGVVVLLGAIKMKNLQSRGFAMAAAIIAMIPCISPCCLLGIPIGIWALVVMNDPNVRDAFED